MSSNFFVLDFILREWNNRMPNYWLLQLHIVLWKLCKCCRGPFALDRRSCSQNLLDIVFQSFPPHRVIKFLELKFHFILFHISQRLVFHISIEVSRWHERMFSPFQIDIKSHIFVLIHEFLYLRWFEEVPHSDRGSSKIAEIEFYIL